MKTVFCTLLAGLALFFWILAWSTLDLAFVIIFLVIIAATWAIMRLLLRYARVLAYILLGLVIIGILTIPALRDLLLLFGRETLQFGGARRFVWAVLFTVIFGVACLARPGSSSA